MTETFIRPESQPAYKEAIDKTPPKVEVKFDEKKMTLLLGLEGQVIDSGLSEKLASHGFKPKDELHMTVLGFKDGGKLVKALKAMSETERQTALDTITTAAQNTEWNVTPNGQYMGL